MRPTPFMLPTERVLRAAVARAFALELAVSLLFCLGFLQGYDLRLGQDQAFLRNLGFQRLEPFLHRLEIMALPDAAHPGRGDRVAKFPHFVGDADLAEGRLLHRKFNDPLRDLGRGPVRQDRLLAADLLQRQLAAFVIEILEAVEAIAAIAAHLAGLAHIAKLPGELQQAHLSLDNLLVLRHRWCPHKRPRPGSPQPWPAPRPPRLSLRPYDTKCRIKYQLVQMPTSVISNVIMDASGVPLSGVTVNITLVAHG